MGRGGRSLSPPLALSFSLCLPTIDNEKQRRRTLRPSFSLAFSLCLSFLSLSYFCILVYLYLVNLSHSFPLYSGPAAELACSTIPRWFLLSTAAPTKDTNVYIASLIQCRNISSSNRQRRQALPRSSATRETHDASLQDVPPVARYTTYTARFAAFQLGLV